MRLRITFCDYDPDDAGIMPNAVAVVDDYMEDEHGGVPQWYDDQVAEVRSKCEQGAVFREMFVEIPDSAVEALFQPPTIGPPRVGVGPSDR